MAEPPRYPDCATSDGRADAESRDNASLLKKVLIVSFGLLVVIVVVLHLLLGGGPRH
jgi:hypothetical protein